MSAALPGPVGGSTPDGVGRTLAWGMPPRRARDAGDPTNRNRTAPGRPISTTTEASRSVRPARYRPRWGSGITAFVAVQPFAGEGAGSASGRPRPRNQSQGYHQQARDRGRWAELNWGGCWDLGENISRSGFAQRRHGGCPRQPVAQAATACRSAANAHGTSAHARRRWCSQDRSGCPSPGALPTSSRHSMGAGADRILPRAQNSARWFPWRCAATHPWRHRNEASARPAYSLPQPLQRIAFILVLLPPELSTWYRDGRTRMSSGTQRLVTGCGRADAEGDEGWRISGCPEDLYD